MGVGWQLTIVIDPSYIQSIKLFIASIWQPLADWIRAWRQTLDPVVWLAGSLLALIPGSFAIYKWWTYRNSRLPKHLNEFISREDLRLKNARKALLEAVQEPTKRRQPVPEPIFSASSLTKITRSLGWRSWIWTAFPNSAADAELEAALVEIEQQLQFCDKSRATCKAQEATAYLLKGAIAASRAATARPEDAERHNRSALSHFLRALDIDPDDLEAREYTAQQQRILGQADLAIENLERLATSQGAKAVDDRQVAARANRQIAELLLEKFDTSGIVARLTEARGYLDDALDRLPHDAKGGIEEARINEIYGRVLEKIGQTQLPRTYWDRALAAYDTLRLGGAHKDEASSAYLRVEKFISDFVSLRRSAQPQDTTPAHSQ